MLALIEQKSIGFADAVLTCTEQMRRALVRRGAGLGDVSVMMNTGNPDLIGDPILPDPAGCDEDAFRVVTHGTITKRYGHDVLIQAMAIVAREVPGARLEIMGDGTWRAELEQLAKGLDLDGVVDFAGYVPLDELISRLRAADCGVVSLPRNIETDLIHTHKMHEYMALGIPVVVSRTEAVEAYYDSGVCFFEAGDEEDLAQALLSLYESPDARYRLASDALEAYDRHSPSKQKARYLDVVRSLLGHGPSRRHGYGGA